MADLSSAAQAILKVAYKATRNPNWQTNFYSSYAAAVLRTAADQVVPVSPEMDDKLVMVRYRLCSIADELEPSNHLTSIHPVTQQHSITPPPQWQMDAWQARIETMGADVPAILLEVAQWGADQELEACIDFVRRGRWCSEKLRATRRPKPPSLKEQALEALETAQRAIASPSSNRTHLGLTQDAPESSDLLVDRVADAIYRNGTGDGFREEARAAIRAVADWFEQHGWHTSAAIMRQEVG